MRNVLLCIVLLVFSFSLIFNYMLLIELDKIIGNPVMIDKEVQIFNMDYAHIIGYSIIPTIIVTVIMYYTSKLFNRINIESLESQKDLILNNKTITKITIVLFLIWLIISFIISDIHFRFKIDKFMTFQIPPILIIGYLWIRGRLTLK